VPARSSPGLAELTPQGRTVWDVASVPGNSSCSGFIGPDVAATAVNGVTYTLIPNPDAVGAISPTGHVLWSTSLGNSTSALTLGWNRTIYVGMFNGIDDAVVAVNATTGRIIGQLGQFDLVTGLHAYSGGVIVIVDGGEVDYFGYAGKLQHFYQGSIGALSPGYSSARGAAGTVFLAGYDGGGHLTLEKVTPAGIAWTWTGPLSSSLNQTVVVATADGGAVITTVTPNPTYVSVSPTGVSRWTFAPHVRGAVVDSTNSLTSDVNNITTIPYEVETTCPQGQCRTAVVRFVESSSGRQKRPSVTLRSNTQQGFQVGAAAIAANRLYLTVCVLPGSSGCDSLAAFNILGLGRDFALVASTPP
jgi:hypothetical protein